MANVGDKRQELEVNGHVVVEYMGRNENVVYVGSKMVTTQWDETVRLLEDGGSPGIEDCTIAMYRVMGCR